MKLAVIASIIFSITSASAVADGAIASKSQRGQNYTGEATQSTPAQPGGEREMKAVSYSFPIENIRQLDFSQKQAHVQSRQFKLERS